MIRFRFRCCIRPPIAVAAALAATGLGEPTALTAQVASRVRVEVRETATDAPVANVTVETAGLVSYTAHDGRAVLRGLPPGRHLLRARHVGYAPAEADVKVENGRTTEVVIFLHPRPVELAGIDVDVLALPGGARRVTPDDVGPGVRTVADLVETVSGVGIVRRGGPGTPVVPTIRGSSGDQVLVLVDGVAINSPLTGDADLSEVDLDQVARVVVIPGARASRYGAGALAGVILIETRRPEGTGGVVALELGSLGVRGATLSATASRGPSWVLSAGGAWSRAGGAFQYPVPAVRGGGIARRRNANVAVRSGFLQAAWERPQRAAFRLRIHGRDSERGSPGTVVQPSLTGMHEQRRRGAVLQGDAGGPARGWHATIGLDEHHAIFADPSPPFGPAYRSESQVRQVEARVEGRRTAGWLSLSAGMDGRIWRIRANALAEDAPGRIAGTGAWIRASSEGSREGDTWWDASGTLRWDWHDLLGGPAASPSASVAASWGGTTVEVSAGASVSPPDISDLFFEEGILAEANPDLAPERVRSEVGLEIAHRLARGGWEASGSIAAFRADIDGMILWLPDHRFVWSPGNVDVRRYGVDARAEVRRGAVGPLSAGASWTSTTYDQPPLGGQVVYHPRVTAHAAATVRLNRVALSALWRYTGSRRTAAGTDLNSLPGYPRLDIGGSVPFRAWSARGEVEVTVTNVLDDPAALLVDYPLPGRMLFLRIEVGTAPG